MPAQLDLTVLPLFRLDGRDNSYLPGLLAAELPRRTARGRGEERLLLHLSSPPDLNLSPEAQASLLQDMADGYYRTPGAVTSALREQIERLNAYFLQRNQQADKVTPAPALLSAVTVREGRITLAQCGPVQAFLLGAEEPRHFYDPQAAGRGLGLSQNTDIRFSQFDLQPDQLILLLAELPATWTEKTLSDTRGQKLGTLRRRFLSESGPSLQAAMLAAQAGTGQLRLLAGAEIETTTSAAQGIKPAAQGRQAGTEIRSQPWESLETPAEEAVPVDEALVHQTQPVITHIVPAGNAAEDEADKPSGWSHLLARLSRLKQRTLPPLLNFLQRVLPEEPIFNLPPRVMGLIAILVPVAVVVLVAAIYLLFGRQQLYINYLERAQSAAAFAAASENPADVRQAWQGVVFYAERAAYYEEDAQTAADLLAQAQAALDEMDAIRRVEFGPALFQPLALDARIARIVATNNEIYMLNATDGSILRAFLTGDGAGGGYQLDANFSCQPGPYGDFIVSELVDLALLPRGNALNADLLAMDANGNVIYCASGERPAARALVAPDSHWGRPQALTVENGNLYVLDPLNNAVWIYFGEDYSYAESPRFFFGAQVPNLRRMLDLAVEGEDLFLINEDGRMAICRFSDDIDNPSTCEDPAQYTDTRPGREAGPQVAGANFEQIQIGEPPQPSLYMLDPVARAVYRLSLSLGLDTQFQSLVPLPEGLATAFAITPNRAILLAIENDVYIGFIPSDP